MGLDDLIMKDVLPEANGLELPFRVARGARLLGLVRLMEHPSEALPGGPGVESMIVSSFGHIAPQTAHDHEIAPRVGPQSGLLRLVWLEGHGMRPVAGWAASSG